MFNFKRKNNNYKNIFMLANKKRKFRYLKFLSISLSFVCFIILSNLALNYKYSSITVEFFSEFNELKFESAKSILDNKVLYLKKNKLNKDLENYFTNVVEVICTSLDNNQITNTKALEILNEVKEYDILNSSLDSLITHLNDNYDNSNSEVSFNEEEKNSIYSDITSSNENKDSIENYFDLALNSYNSKDYSKAYEYFSSYINSTDTNSNKELSSSYLKKIKKEYKDSLLSEVEELVANKYYTKSIELLNSYDTNILGNYDEDIYNKISSIELFREEYTESIYTSSAILTNINLNNVNTMAIESNTDYFVYVNLAEQKTYVYQGFLNNWKLIKSFLSSTGLPEKETPKGIFDVTNRGEWFFSEEFNQGAKYWVQFMGDYLFHSLPFDETQENIVDSTLGEPASHGCIRLAVEDAKWLYDTIPNNTKIIIN